MSTALIEVRVRLASEARATHLCTWPSTELDSLLTTLSRWGLMRDSVDFSDDAMGQFTYEDGEAYFEIVVGLNDEE